MTENSKMATDFAKMIISARDATISNYDKYLSGDIKGNMGNSSMIFLKTLIRAQKFQLKN